jgi:hypothetical protein
MTAPTTPLPIPQTARPRVPAPASKPKTGRWDGVPVTLLLSALIAINVLGAPYYLAPPSSRPRHAWHQLLKPSGDIGQTAGILAFLIFVFLWLYPLRKRWKSLKWTGAVARWLDVHVTTALGLPLLLTIHAAWRADGVIGLGFGAMLVVCASGIVGRYLYVRIPRAKSGVELTREEVAAEQQAVLAELSTALDQPVDELRRLIEPAQRSETLSVWGVLEGLLLNDLRRWRRRRELSALWGRQGISRSTIRRAVALASKEIALTDQVNMLAATQRVFRYWHIAHMPFALTALLAVTVHVVVVIAVGQTWFW